MKAYEIPAPINPQAENITHAPGKIDVLRNTKQIKQKPETPKIIATR